MAIFAELLLFVVIIAFAARFIQNEIAVRLLKKTNAELVEKNAELLELLTGQDTPIILPPGSPPKGKHILHD